MDTSFATANRRSLVAIAGLTALCLAGCSAASSAPQSKPTPRLTSTASPRPSPSPSLKTAEAVLAATANYFVASDLASATGDVRPLAVLMHQRCSCRAVLKVISDDFANGGHQIGAHSSFKDVHFLGLDQGEAVVSGTETLSAYQTINGAGQVTASFAAHSGPAQLRFKLEDDAWLLLEDTHLAKP